MSNMYSLLNYVATTSKEIHDGPHNIPPFGISSNMDGEYPLMQSDRATVHSIDTVAHGRTEEERRLITTSTISVVSRLALEFKLDEVSIVVSIKTILVYNHQHRLLD
jgi:phosphatidylinositol 4-kinase